jgi:c-di-GMP-related signal transduction protein
MAGDKPPELIRTALTRAFFCEAMSHHAGLSHQSSDLFLMGLLSVTDAMLIRAALSGGANRLRDVYDALLAYEHADWPALTKAAARLGPVEFAIPDCYAAATQRSAALVS